MKVKVHPNSGRQEVVEGDIVKIYLKSQPENGKANEELLKILKKHFGKRFRIKSGFTSKNKVVEEV